MQQGGLPLCRNSVDSTICGVNSDGSEHRPENDWYCERYGDRHLSSAPIKLNSEYKAKRLYATFIRVCTAQEIVWQELDTMV